MQSTKYMSWDLRPFSEYFYEQAQGRKDFKFLFYCRNCVKNFDAPTRVQKCKFCSKENIIELPKFVWKRRQIFKKAVTAQNAKALFAKLAKKLKDQKMEGFDFATRMRMAMIYYFNVPAETTEDISKEEDISQGNLLGSFRLV